jgi:hypothetical protein
MHIKLFKIVWLIIGLVALHLLIVWKQLQNGLLKKKPIKLATLFL